MLGLKNLLGSSPEYWNPALVNSFLDGMFSWEISASTILCLSVVRLVRCLRILYPTPCC